MKTGSMPTSPDLARTDVQDFAKRLRAEMIPLSARLSYFSTVPLGDDDARELGTAEFAGVVQDALDELPPAVLERLRNVPLIADDRPSKEMVRDGTDPRILGLFHGLSMPHESTLGPGFPDTIHLFSRNIERVCDDERELREEIRVTVLHETAHYFGFDEDELARLGLG